MSGAAARTGRYNEISKINLIEDTENLASFKRGEMVSVEYKYIQLVIGKTIIKIRIGKIEIVGSWKITRKIEVIFNMENIIKLEEL